MEARMFASVGLFASVLDFLTNPAYDSLRTALRDIGTCLGGVTSCALAAQTIHLRYNARRAATMPGGQRIAELEAYNRQLYRDATRAAARIEQLEAKAASDEANLATARGQLSEIRALYAAQLTHDATGDE
jgi:hypothetical protein